ncbi:hypothetical protein CABS01_08743 [Colletotrichum abscissum]|uniref:Uncharacterized protein n=2 Tax=Colletotrichum acutatum species complex TaxID=2707335 RepID=A0A9Q8WG53_9PEZI|nr:uncharacterized protein CLUP02_07936 [Colletotrichum lupini]XP_060375775.1 uncharacterized protein CTAM01_13679 [Colletotrichum tamarilloi]XP_060400991.1 uncharacterized protein CABS01_08743 [Colletotrichum abscissum]KAI3550324.1 hypothetical protein CSPX01_01922 [Colletotrichum filicis]KAK1482226.1 hypothetical protein CTAM01_13679 [Colletotrichum tamarilloi]KAK1504965.1 hypothetical protein CABS01_08743 [Colletotrichum abscissum]UQC82448.1 hypothetical protein CLUP02_07936 [Colletotrichu
MDVVLGSWLVFWICGRGCFWFKEGSSCLSDRSMRD